MSKFVNFLRIAVSDIAFDLVNADGGNGPKLKRIKDRISAIPEGKELIELLEDKGVKIAIIPMIGPLKNKLGTFGAIQDFDNILANNQPNILSSHIVLSDKLSEDELISVFIHEAWHAKQAHNGYYSMPVNGSAEDFCLFNSAIEADAQTKAVDLSYKMKLKGDIKAWDGLVDNNKTAYENIDKYEKETGMDMNNNALLVSSWFGLSKRKESYDITALSFKKDMESNISKHDNYNPPSERLDPNYMKGLGKLSKVDYSESLDFSDDKFHKISDKVKGLISQKFGDTQQVKRAKPSARNKPTF